MELKDVIHEMQSMSRAKNIDNYARQTCSAAAEALTLVAWAHEVGAKIQPWGSQWRCSIEFAHNDSGHYHGDTLLDSIREAKEAYETQQ